MRAEIERLQQRGVFAAGEEPALRWGMLGTGGIAEVFAATVHANDAVSGLIRLESLVAEATSAPQQALIAEAVDVVVFIDQEPGLPAGRKVREVALVTGYRDGRYQVEFV